jgi:mannosyltransferase
MTFERIKIPLLIGLIFAINLLFKGVYLGENSLAWDEPFSVYHAQLPADQLVDVLISGNNPPLYELFLHQWTSFFGLSEVSVRFPSLIFSSLTAVFLFLIGKRHFNLTIALSATLLFTFSNYHVFFAHEARVYALFGMLATASMFIFMTICSQEKMSLKNLFWLLLVNVLMIYGHYFGFFIVLFQAFFVLSVPAVRQKIWKHFLVYGLLLILLYLPLIAVVFGRFLESTTQGTWIESPNNLAEIYEMLRKFANAPVVVVVCLLVLLLGGVFYFVRTKTEPVKVTTKIVITWFLIPFLLMFVLSFWIPMFIDRYLIFLTIPFYLLIAIAANSLVKNPKMVTVIQGVVVLLFLVTSKPNLDNRRPVKEVMNKISELKTANTAVYFCPQHFIFNYAYYYNRSLFEQPTGKDPYLNMTNSLANDHIYGIHNFSEIDTTRLEKIIYLDAGADFSSPGNGIYDFLNGNYTLKETHEFPEIFRVFVFEGKGE